MRIIAGARRGKQLFVPDDLAIRPTGERARAAIFNILAHQSWIDVATPLPQGARVLDLACGTGALACEALSRGAAQATLFDNHAAALALAKKNVAAIGAAAQGRIEFADLSRLPVAAAPYDLIFCDPPYDQGLAVLALTQLQPQGYLQAKTIIVVETGVRESLPLPPGLTQLDRRRYGAALVWFIGVAL